MNSAGLKHSDYIVYVDESGDHSLKSIDEGYPIFVLTFCVFLKEYYSDVVTPAVRRLKFATFGCKASRTFCAASRAIQSGS